MRDCTSANGDHMTASKRECWSSTSWKAIVSTIKEKEGIVFHACFPPEERARTVLSSDKVRGSLCLCSELGPGATPCREQALWSELSTPLKNEWVPRREKSDQQLRKSKKQKPEVLPDRVKWVWDKEIHIPYPLLKFCLRALARFLSSANFESKTQKLCSRK